MTLATLLLLCLAAGAQERVYTRTFSDKQLVRDARRWMKAGKWRGEFTKAKPHKSVNAADFYTQYERNKSQWDAAFGWLASNDLLSLPRGKYPIEGTTLVASVEDSDNGDLAKRQSESHYHHVDLQYCVSGVEGFGVIDHATSKPNCKYRPDVIHYDYDVKAARFYDSTPDRFFLFFPGDWHIAKVKTRKATEKIRVVVIKLDYVE